MEREVHVVRDGLEQLQGACNDLLSLLNDVHQLGWGVFNSLERFHAEAGARTHDVEILIGPILASRVLSQQPLQPIRISAEDFRAELRPKGTATVFVGTSSSGLAVPPQCIGIGTRWDVESSFLPEQEWMIVLTVSFKVQPGAGGLRPLLARGIRVYDKELKPVWPLRLLPVRWREEVNRQVEQAVADILQTFSFDYSAFDLPGLPQSQPHTYWVSGTAISLLSRTLPRRRGKRALAAYIPARFNLQVRLFRDHLTPRISQAVGQGGATLESLDFRPGFIQFVAFRRDARHILHIKVIVEVRLTYHAQMLAVNPTTLYFHAFQVQYWWKVTAKNCWPVCGKIIKEARKTVMQEIDRAKIVQTFFAQFPPPTVECRASVDTYGLTMNLRRT